MLAKVYCAALHGIESYPVEVEIDYRHGMSYFAIVGLGDKSVQEAKERIISALRNSGAEYVPKRLIINLAPANRPKSGAQFDLAIAVGYLVATKQISLSGKVAFLGELALHGQVKAVSGALALATGLYEQGFREIYVPADNYAEVSLLPGLKAYPVKHLRDLIAHFKFGQMLSIPKENIIRHPPRSNIAQLFPSQQIAFRALTIAAAGGHHVVMSGSPGTGKSTLARLMPQLLPELAFADQLVVTRIHSIRGQLSEGRLLTTPPFRAPHHSITLTGLVGGTGKLRPGEITLAHKGVLFLDELAEFGPAALEALRQPLEEKYVTVSRETSTISFPADFICIAALNPCKCGYYGDQYQTCLCSPHELKTYKKRISGALWERFDLQVNLFTQTQSGKQVTIDLEEYRAQVLAARQRQLKRGKLNAQISSLADIDLDKEGKLFLERLATTTLLSPRSYLKVLKVAQTIADLENSAITAQHLSEAVGFRLKRD